MSDFKNIFQTKIVVRPNTVKEEHIRQLHLAATKHIGEGELDKAIELLSEAGELMPKVAVEYPIQSYLRLPVTLQKAGRFHEAVKEFNRLLEINKRPYDRANIYDKLRLGYQREAKHQEAIEFGVLHLAWECIGLERQNGDSLVYVEEPDRWLKQIKKSLKAIGKERNAETILSKCVSFARDPSEPAITALILAVRDLL